MDFVEDSLWVDFVGSFKCDEDGVKDGDDVVVRGELLDFVVVSLMRGNFLLVLF